MDREFLSENFGMLTLRQKCEDIALNSMQDRVIQREIDSVIAHHKKVQAGFKQIFDTVDYEESKYGDRSTPDINLANISDPELGNGTIFAVLHTSSSPDNGRSYQRVYTSFSFRREGFDDFLLSNACEQYSSVIGAINLTAKKLRFFAQEDSLDFSDPAYIMTDRWRSDITKIEAAENTIAMIQEAIADPDLNPDFAE